MKIITWSPVTLQGVHAEGGVFFLAQKVNMTWNTSIITDR
jgi:hypothetical protein